MPSQYCKQPKGRPGVHLDGSQVRSQLLITHPATEPGTSKMVNKGLQPSVAPESNPKAYMVEGENWLLKAGPLTPTCGHTHMHSQNKEKTFKEARGWK